MGGAGLDFLGSLAPWNGQGGFNTDAMLRAAEAWGNPQNATRSVHVAGTNGKGSVSAFIAAILGASGIKVGLTTSPHLETINERIVIDGFPISDELLDRYALELRALLSHKALTLSFFEAITLIFFHACRDQHVDFMVVEVGLGGRLDATNIISRPEVTVIVTVDLDHQDILGATVAEIAAEKAGIIKERVPVVVGEIKRDAIETIASIAKVKHAPLFLLGKDFKLDGQTDKKLVHSGINIGTISIKPSLNGGHQLDNAAVAAMTACLLGASPNSIEHGISGAHWPGRIETVHFGGRRCILDAGHNPAGIRTLVEYLKTEQIQDVDIGFGVLGTKNWPEIVDLLMPMVSSWNLLRPQSAVAVKPEEIASYLSSHGVSSVIFGGEYDRYLEQLNNPARAHIPVVMAGSIYLMGALRGRMGIEPTPLWTRRPLN